MTHTFFDIPLVVFPKTTRACDIISTVDEASDFLFDNWLDHDSDAWDAAMKLCARAETGAGSVREARAAFVTAIRAVGMHVDQTASNY